MEAAARAAGVFAFEQPWAVAKGDEPQTADMFKYDRSQLIAKPWDSNKLQQWLVKGCTWLLNKGSEAFRKHLDQRHEGAFETSTGPVKDDDEVDDMVSPAGSFIEDGPSPVPVDLQESCEGDGSSNANLAVLLQAAADGQKWSPRAVGGARREEVHDEQQSRQRASEESADDGDVDEDEPPRQDLHPVLSMRTEARGANLSGGFAQSVALARAFLREDAQILVLDEALSQVRSALPVLLET